MATPSVLFLDEATTGLDPTARVALWDVVAELTPNGTTVVLTTQYLEEADRIVVLDHGRVAGRGTSHELKWLVGGRVVTTAVAVGHLDRLDDRADLVRPAGPGSVIATFGVDGVDAAAALVARFNHSRAHSAALAIAGRHAR